MTDRGVAWAYGIGRIAFGLGVFAAPRQVGNLLVGRQPDTDAASDVLDVAGQLLDWQELEPGRRIGGIAFAAAAALAGLVALRGKQ